MARSVSRCSDASEPYAFDERAAVWRDALNAIGLQPIAQIQAYDGFAIASERSASEITSTRLAAGPQSFEPLAHPDGEPPLALVACESRIFKAQNLGTLEVPAGRLALLPRVRGCVMSFPHGLRVTVLSVGAEAAPQRLWSAPKGLRPEDCLDEQFEILLVRRLRIEDLADRSAEGAPIPIAKGRSRAMSDLTNRVLLADAFHAPEALRVETLERLLVRIDGEGIIAAIWRPGEPGYEEALASARREGVLVEWPERQYLLPGLVDLHVHAPQYPQLGAALDEPLEIWLNKYTFPLEARYADLAFARASYQKLITDLIAEGTTTALYFATIHQDATRALADICLAQGQRALIGRVAMDNAELCPDFYRDPSAEAAVAETRAFIDYVHAHPANTAGRVTAVVTPRFIPACTDAALQGLGALARERACPVQTHASESDWEHGYVLERHGMTDAESLDRFGLVGRRTVLAHAVHLTEADMDLLTARGAGVAHCPASNAYFADAVFPLRAALRKGLHVGLGTDISGGPGASLFDASRTAILASRMLESGVDAGAARGARGGVAAARIDFRAAFHLATAGGGEALDLPIGLFAPGYRFDAIRIDAEATAGGIRLWDFDRGEQTLQKIIYGATRANVAGVWVDGRSLVNQITAQTVFNSR